MAWNLLKTVKRDDFGVIPIEDAENCTCAIPLWKNDVTSIRTANSDTVPSGLPQNDVTARCMSGSNQFNFTVGDPAL